MAVRKIIYLLILFPLISGCLIGPFILRKNSVDLKCIGRHRVYTPDYPPYGMDQNKFESFETKLIALGMTTSEVKNKIGPPAKIINKKGQQCFIYHTGDPRLFLAGIIWVGREQYILFFDNDKLIDILFYTSGQLIEREGKI